MCRKEFRAIIFQNVLILCASAVLWKQTTVTATQVTRPRGVSLASNILFIHPSLKFSLTEIFSLQELLFIAQILILLAWMAVQHSPSDMSMMITVIAR